MMKCPKCGYDVPDGAKFCPQCSNPMSSDPSQAQPGAIDPQSMYNYSQPNYSQPGYNQPPYYNAPQNTQPKNATGMMVWAILNLIFCCLPLGIAGLVLTAGSKNDPPEVQEKKIKNAMICNIIGTVGGVLVYVLLFATGVIAELAAYSVYY